ncbi:MAG: formyltetrahydrofolate deformylase [Firmicutes bacterium]|nr:formyltetrahydrofolate deformylase [Bacillota bacterium]MBO2521233.1 formyltetrahydrofolate deformylase [Bacillota bacterium]
MHMPLSRRACLLISCPDRPGIVASVSGFLFERGANIVQLDQYSTHPEEGTYFMRLEFDAEWVNGDRARIEREFAQQVAAAYQMDWRFAYADHIKRMAVFVSKEDHCLLELLWQWRWGDLRAEIPMVISNHDTLRETVESFGIPFYHLPITKETKRQQEEKALELMEGRVDFIVLARYMQILTGDFIQHYPNRIINIHHSFLPAFVGGRPYEQAYERGVKIIGATAHYVTEELDAGPIIEQDVARVDHRNDVAQLKAIGRNIERTVLARAVRWHIQDRILVHGNKTIVFAG